ncbi:MAG: hypothetical protein ACM3JH_04945 [Acidithiobacillales bacterium]
MKPLAGLAILLLGLPTVAQEPTPPPDTSRRAAPSAGAAVTPTPAAIRSPAPPPIGTGGTSLADIARRQKELREREGKRPSLGVISNETLRKGAAAGEASPGKGGSKSKAPPTPAPRAAAPVVASVPEWRDAKGRTEGDWKGIMAAAHQRIAASESRVKSLEEEARRYENDFYAWSDGNYRERVIRPAWDQAREELGKARAELDAARSHLSDLEEDARKSGTPPGWLR